MANFYKSTAWIKKRAVILRRDNNECQRCKAKGRFHKAECVHHIKHLKDRPDLALVDSNLQSLCFACHNEVHPEKMKFNYNNKNNKKRYITKERW